MDSDNEDNDELDENDDTSHVSPNYALYVNETPKFAVYDAIYLNPDQLKPLSQKNKIS